MKLRDVPNLLSFFRILLVPFFIGEFLKSKYVSCLVIFCISGLSDIIDGYIARKYSCESALGRILDPIADKLTYATVFFCLLSQGRIPLFFVLVFVLVGLAQGLGAIYVYKTKNNVVKSNIAGKLAGFSMFVFSVILLFNKGELSGTPLYVLSAVVACAIVIAMLAYFYRYILSAHMRSSSREEKNK